MAMRVDTPAEPRPAAVVIPVRDGGGGLEVLLLQRSRRSRFLPGTWVFPGGALEEVDGRVPLVGGEEAAARMGTPNARVLMVAGLRELFEEAGLPFRSGLSVADRAALISGELTLEQLCARREWSIDVGGLHPWAHWITPEREPLRFDAWFFALVVEPAVEIRHDRQETVASGWFEPAAALARHVAGGMLLSPPVFRTLQELAECADPEAVVAASGARALPPIMPRWLDQPGGHILFLLPGDVDYPAARPVAGATRILWDGHVFTSLEVPR